MKYIIATLLVVIFAFPVMASQTCTGKVVSLIEYPGKCDAGRLAFQTTVTGDKWVCAISDRTESILLTAYAADKRLGVRLDLPTPNKCDSINNYQTPLYISIKD